MFCMNPSTRPPFPLKSSTLYSLYSRIQQIHIKRIAPKPRVSISLVHKMKKNTDEK